MEGRGRPDSGAVRRSGTFSGRQVPLQMGEVRVGGSGRPVPTVFSAAASRRAVTSSQEAAPTSPAALPPRVTLEPYPQSPFRRKEELSKTVVRVPEDSMGSRFQLKKVTGPLRARSPQIRYQGNWSTASEFGTHLTEIRSSRDDGMELSTSGEGAQIGRIEQNGKTSRLREQVTSKFVEKQQSRVEEISTRDRDDASAVDLMLTEEQEEEVLADVPEENMLQSNSEDVRPLELPNRKALALPAARAGAGTFVSSMPSLTKLRSTFTARELALFTQRQETSDPEGNTQTRYHVASHPHSAIVSPVSQTNQERLRSQERGTTHKRALPSSDSRREAGSFSSNKNRQLESSWRQVDTSIDHIYEDPSIDMVQLHLLHSHHTVSGQKKWKMVERERVLAAASGLREHQSEEQRRQEQLQQRKLQLQKMSEAIRLQNQRAVRARAANSAGLDDRRVKSGRRSESGPALPERKPPVPRLSRNGTSARQQQSKRKRKPKSEVSCPQGGVSASILMDVPLDSSVQAIQQEIEDNEKDAAAHEEIANPPVDHQTAKRKPPATTPRLSKKKKQVVATQSSESNAAIRAREERRAIAREYMQLQKNSRRIWSAKAKEQSQREQEKRQQQLEILEASRLKNLRLSKKRVKDPKKHEMDDPAFTDESRTATVAVSIVPSSSPIMPDISIDASTKPRDLSEGSRSDKELVLDEPHSDNENDQAIGNIRVPELLLDYETGMTSSNAKPRSNPVLEPEANQNTDTDERVRKLLELREKAAALSARLSGLRNRTDNTENVDSTKEILEHERLDVRTNDPIMIPGDDDFQAATSDTRHSTLVNYDKGSEQENEQDAEQRERDDNNHSSGKEVERERESQEPRRSEKANSKCSDSSSEHDITRDTGRAELAQSSLVNEEDGSSSITRSQRVVHENQTCNSVSDGIRVYDDNEVEEIDVRSIGVYNIGVVWPIQQQGEALKSVSETKQVVNSPLASSSSSSSSAASSPPASPTNSRRDEWPVDLGETRDEAKEDSEGAFEVKFYEQLKNRLNTSSTLVDGATDEATTSPYREESKEQVKSNSESDSELSSEHFPVHASQRRGFSADRSVMQGRGKSVKCSASSSGLMQLIRETDDSLSVIDRAAKKLYHEQCERSEREREKELQKRMEAEKKELLEKEMVLKAVMASLTGKKSDSEVSDLEADADLQSCDDENEMQSEPYKRLEEIMDEVEKERSREKEESGGSRHDEFMPSDYERRDNLEQRSTRFQDSKAHTHQREGIAASSSSAFWDHLVSESIGNEFNHPDRVAFDRRHVEIDDSELVAQRDSRLRDDDEQMADSPPRVHSPRTLSRRLMAAVDYQEAIFEAHMQLSMMEHTHELETVQAETITLAQAFNEEMEHNASSHQLALDHATLEKKFDGDMHDVMQQLDTIRQVEEQERAANESRMEHELRTANLRECSMQTEASQRADAATSAALYVDTSTSPVRFVVDAAVQHDTTEQKSPVVETQHELEYESEEDNDAYEETFEKESQMQVDQLNHNKASGSNVLSIAESQTHSPPQSENDSESEIQSVLSDQAEDDNFEESDVVKSIADEESFAEESAAVSAEESAIDDEVHESQSNQAVESNADVLASMEYDDDFEASSPKMRAVPNRTSLEATSEDDVEDELEMSRSKERSEDNEDIEEQVAAKSDSATTGEEAVSDYVESSHYSSQFEDTARRDLKGTTKLAIKQPATVVHGTEISTVQTQSRHRGGGVPPPAPVDLEFNVIQTSESVSATYMRDLERRKQAEESLLDLRLQTVDQKYQREVEQLENAIGSEALNTTRAVHELRMRKVTLTMAFLAAKANIESLKAASTARYYQDLHAFRSLSLDWPRAVGRGNDGGESGYFFSERIETFVPPEVTPLPTYPAPSKSTAQVDDEQNASTRHADEYTDEFGSDLENDNADEVEVEEANNYGSAENAEAESIVSDHSEVRDNTSEPSDVPDTSEIVEEEEANEEDISNSVQEEEDQYEDEFASMSENETTAIVVAEIAESSEIADQTEADSVHGDSEYDEDFASVSESAPNQVTGPTKPSAAEDVDIEEQDLEENISAVVAGEVSTGSDIVEDETVPQTSVEQVRSDGITESNQRKYSDDDFESGHLEQFALPRSEPMLEEQSVGIREGQSHSEDSSMTKLLVAEVATLQEATGETCAAHDQAEDSKLVKKKAKAEELLQAKDRLINQQKQAFRRDEEKRQVDVFAKLALGVDVEGELRRAKAEIAQQLASEFDTLQQTYPVLKATSSLAEDVVPTKDKHQDAVSAPSVMSKLFGKGSVDRSSVVEDDYDEEYEAESFEEERNDYQIDNKTNFSKQNLEVASYDADEVEERQPGDRYSNNEVEAEDSNFEVASDDPSHQSDVAEDVLPSVADGDEEEEEERIVDDQKTSGAKAGSDDYDNDYENDYEKESFDEAQAVPDVLSEYGEGDVSLIEETPAQDNTKDEGMLEKSGYDDEDAYSDEAFDSVSGSFTKEAPPVFETIVSPSTRQVTTTSEFIFTEAVTATEETSAKEEELTEAIETVVAQLEDEKPTKTVCHAQLEPDPAVEAAVNERNSLINSVSASLSRDEEEGSLTKSIEERTARLQALKQKIEDRKSEILAVQKKMRVERRKEHLVAEEKVLWDEMEFVERLLYADETALALCRQRNRLEMMQLEARQLEHSIRGKPNKSLCEQEIDLLLGFDYIEEARINTQQQRYLPNVSLAPRGDHITRGFDLLNGYAYVEAVESIDSNVFTPVAAIVHETNAEEGDAAHYDNGIQTKMGEPVHAVNYAEIGVQHESLTHYNTSDHADDEDMQESDDERFTTVKEDEQVQGEQEDEGNYDGIQQETGIQQASVLENHEWSSSKHRQDSFDRQVISDLLAGYAFVEVAEDVSDSQSDLLAGFDYVELAEAVETMSVDDTEVDYQATEALSDVGLLLDSSTTLQVESRTKLEETTIGGEGGSGSSVRIEKSIENEKSAEELDPISAAIVVNSDPIEVHRFEVAPDEDAVVDRVTTLLYTDLFQGLEEDLMATIGYIRNTQDQSDERKLRQSENMGLSSMENTLQVIPTPFSDGLDRQTSEIGSESMDSRYTADWSVEQSSESVLVGSTRMDAPSEAQDEDAMEEDIPSIDSLDEENYDYLREGDKMSGGIPLSEKLAHDSSGEASKDESIKRRMDDEGSSVEIANKQDSESSPRSEYEEVSRNPNDSSDKLLQSERVADAIFASVFDQTIDSELQFWSHQPPRAPSTSSPQAAVKRSNESGVTPLSAVKTTRESTKRVPTQDPRARDRALVQRIVSQLEIVDGQIQLPPFYNFEIGTDASTAHALYDAIEEIARDCFSALQQSASCDHNLSNTSILIVIHRHVQTEIDELLAIRAQSEHELKRQLQLISDESGVETGLTSDVLLSQNCVASNVSTIVSKVQSDLSRTTEGLSTAVQPTQPALLPRTPISRAKSTSILSSLQTQQDQELQQRITGMILNDLLRDAGLP